MTANNVVLTGFMGTGKTSVGRVLAARLGYEFVDTDAVIEVRHGPIADIFNDQGEDAFRLLERKVAAEMGTRSGLVVATGGGMFLDPENEKNLCRGASVFCLTASADEILRRVSEQEDLERPLLAGHDPQRRIAEKLEERDAVYSRFPQVPTDGRTVDEIVEEIVFRIQGRRVRQKNSPRPI